MQNILNAVLYPNTKKAKVDTLLIVNHLTQMIMFGKRKGVELIPRQDDNWDTRKRFIDEAWKSNKLSIYEEMIWKLFLCKGEVLFYIRPNKLGSYDIRFYSKDHYKAYYNEEGDLSKVVIRYDYDKIATSQTFQTKCWIRITVTKEKIYSENFEGTYGLGGEPPPLNNYLSLPNRKEYINSMGFIPCVIAKNNPSGEGQDGVGDFEPLTKEIEDYIEVDKAIQENITMFGSPVVVTSRTAGEVTELANGTSQNLQRSYSAAMQGGWYDSYGGRSYMPLHRSGVATELRLKKVIGNVAGDEMFQFLTPNAVTTDQVRHAQDKREAIHFALGGIDERGIHASATAYEMKVIYGKVATTAYRKAQSIYEYGLCKVFELMLIDQEDLFRKSLAQVLQIPPNDPRYTDSFINQFLAENPVPQGVFGLPPIGKTEIYWRWLGPVFEESADDLQRKSIVARNLQELGINSMKALDFLLPDKTEKEKQAMLSGGYPFRYAQAIAGTTGNLLALYQQMLALPSQQNPKIPMAATLPVEPMISKGLQIIYNELNYEPTFEQPDRSSNPYLTGISAYEQWQQQQSAATVSGTGDSSTPATVPGVSSTPGISGLQWQQLNPVPNSPDSPGSPSNPSPLTNSGITPWAAYPILYPSDGASSVPANSIIPPEYVLPLPPAGGTVATEKSDYSTSTNIPIPGTINSIYSAIPADLAIGALQPGSIYSQLFPELAAQLQQLQSQSGKPKRKSGKSSTTKRKK